MASSTKVKKTSTKPVSSTAGIVKPATVGGVSGVQNNQPGSSVFVPNWVIQKATGFTPAGATAPATPASPATPAAPAPPSGPPAPDSTYNDAVAIALRRRDDRITRDRTAGLTALKDAGIVGDWNLNVGDNGVTVANGGLAIGDDAYLDANPLTAAAKLRDAYRRNASGKSIGLANSGQLYAGSMQNALDSASRRNSDNRAELVSSVEKALGNYATDAQSAYTDWQTEGNAALADLVQRALDARNVPAEDPAAAGGVAPGGIGAPTGESFKDVMASKLKGPNGETLHVTSKGTYYIRKSDGKAIYIKRN